MDGFSFDFVPGAIRFGRGCLEELETALGELGITRVLVVCGGNVGSNDEVMDPVTAGIGDRLGGVFDRTTPQKSFQTAVEGRDRLRDGDIDGIVGIGGGSSLDIAKAMTILEASDRSAADVREFIEANGALPIPDGPFLPVVAVPTTLAGADLSAVGSVTLPGTRSGPPTDDDHSVGGFADSRLMPDALFYEPALFATTPDSVLTASAMNGFDKGIEMLYSRNANPITDATATHGLGLLRGSLPEMTVDPDALERAIVGTILVQYGLSTPGTGKLSIIHAFGHGLARHYQVQQGAAHGIVAPSVLRYVFEQVPGRRALIAEGLNIDPTSSDVGSKIVETVDEIRMALDLPRRLRTIDGLEPEAFPAIAEFIIQDGIMANRPAGLDPSQSAIEGVLEAAW